MSGRGGIVARPPEVHHRGDGKLATGRLRPVPVGGPGDQGHDVRSPRPAQNMPLKTSTPDPAAAAGEPAISGIAVLEHMALRYSVGPKFLGPPEPTDAHLRQAVAVALRAPDHGNLNPFRFVRIAPTQRERLAKLFAQAAARRGQPAQEIERARQRAHNGPALLALVGRLQPGIDDVPEQEQWLCIGGGLMNFLNALHLQGFGAKTLSGASIADPQIQQAFCAPGEVLLAWIVAGTPTRSTHAKRADDAARALTDW